MLYPNLQLEVRVNWSAKKQQQQQKKTHKQIEQIQALITFL